MIADDAQVAAGPEVRIRSPRTVSQRGAIALGAGALIVFVVFTATLMSAISADRDGPYPSRRTDPGSLFGGASLPPQGADVDEFEDDTTLGRFPGHGDWKTVTGTWEVQDGTASARADGSPSALAVIDRPKGDMIFQADLANAEAGSGIVFNRRDDRNQWLVTMTDPQHWDVVAIENGKRRVVRSFMTPSSREHTIGAWIRGNEIVVVRNQVPVLRLRNAEVVPGGQVGITTSSQATRFDNVALLTI